MIWKNLFRRKVRTFLSVFGISLGVLSIAVMGALAEGITQGYDSIIKGGNADIVISQPDTLDVSLSGIDQEIESQLAAFPEIAEVSGMVQGIVAAGDAPYFFIFGYPEDSFMLNRFQIIAGESLNSRVARTARGTPIIIGSAAAEALNKKVGDTLRITNSVYRIIGIYETGSPFEDGGAVLGLADAQLLLGRQRQVGAFYIKLKDPELHERAIARAERLWPKLSVTTASQFADNQIMGDSMNISVMVISSVAIVIGGVAMANAQLMAVYERTREIGVLRAVGWSSRRVLTMILQESLITSLLGGFVGLLLAYFTLRSMQVYFSAFGAGPSFSPAVLLQVLVVILLLGLFGGLYPARRAAQLQPIEALRYEGGSTGNQARRLPFGGMAAQSLWQRSIRTLLTTSVIGLTIGAVAISQTAAQAAMKAIGSMAIGSGAEIMLRQSNVADTSQSVIDQRAFARIAAMPEVRAANGVIFTAIALSQNSFFVLQGHEPQGFAIQRYTIVEGQPLRGNRQIIVGKNVATAMNVTVGDTIELGGSRFKIVGLYETGIGWEDLGGVVTVRDAQFFTGKPGKVTMVSVKLHDPATAVAAVEKLNREIPDIHATLSSEFAEQMPDMQVSMGMLNAVSLMAVLMGGLGIMNTMLMAVLERTREIGALRALGWRRRAILRLILEESALLGLLGGIAGILIAQVVIALLSFQPAASGLFNLLLSGDVILRAVLLALALGSLGGIYPALRAIRMQPIEALRYE